MPTLNQLLDTQRASNFIDITGARFGRLTVLRFDRLSSKRQARWVCACDCGNQPSVRGTDLRRGHTTQCRDCGRKANHVDVTGQTFGLLTAIRWISGTNSKSGKWECRCSCGEICSFGSDRIRTATVCPKCRRAVEAVAKAERAVARKTKQVADTDDRAAERAARAVPHTEVCPLCEVEHTYMLMAGYTPRKYCSPAHARRHRGIIAVRATRARKAGAKVVKRVDPLKIFRRDGYVCQACGLPCNRRVPWFHWDAPECDHIIALANGGDHKEENCQTLHRSCNGAKSRQEFRIENVAYATVENIRNMASVGVDERTLSLKFQIPIGAVRGIIGGRIKPKPAPRTPLPVKQAKMRVRKATEPKPVKVPKVRVPRVPKPRKPRVPKADPKQVEIARREMRKAAAAAQVAKRWAKLIAA